MSYIWVYLVIFYALIKGVRESAKKKAMEKSSVFEVLLLYTSLSFALTALLELPAISTVLLPSRVDYFYVFIKSFVIFIAWICAFHSIHRLPVSLYGVMDMARMLFSTFLAIIILGEPLTPPVFVGLCLVILGLLLVNRKREGEQKKTETVYILLTLVSGFMNAVSGTMDKILMKNLESGELQFWYMLFLSLLYLIYVLARRIKVDIRTLKNNLWIPFLSVIFVAADRALFVANSYPESSVIVMTLIKQCSLLVTVLLGKVVFREKHILYRLFCASIIIAGVIISLTLGGTS